MKYLLILFFCLPLAAFSQRIKINEFDKFIKQRRIETTFAPVKTTSTTGMSVSFKSVGPMYYAMLNGYGSGASTIGVEDQAIFLLENDSTVTLKSTGIQSYETDLTKNRNTYNHEYAISLNGLETLSRHKLKSIRKYMYKGYVNIDIAPRNAEVVKKLSSLFLKELMKEKVIVTQTAIPLDSISKHIGESVTICGKIYSSRYLENVDKKPTLLNMGAAFPNQLLTLVIYGVDRKNFDQNPEDFYADKEVCVTGKVELYNNRPQIVVHNKEQILLKD